MEPITFSEFGKQIKEIKEALRVVQNKRISQESCDECNMMEAKLDDLQCKHEAYWYLQSRVCEVHDGGHNTRYFIIKHLKERYVMSLKD